ncbi:MAG: heme biosynthesis protein HemY, partial [Pseudomonadota bacterium]
RRAPHPDLFRAALELEPPAADARLKRAKAMAALRADHVESAIGLARAALSAREPDTARAALMPHLENQPSQRVCILMAELEALAPGDEGRVRDWLARAVRAPKDPQWIADGVTAAAWAPVSPVTGRLDAFEWRVPPSLGEPAVPSIDLGGPAIPDEGGEGEALPGPSVPPSAQKPD